MLEYSAHHSIIQLTSDFIDFQTEILELHAKDIDIGNQIADKNLNYPIDFQFNRLSNGNISVHV